METGIALKCKHKVEHDHTILDIELSLRLGKSKFVAKTDKVMSHSQQDSRYTTVFQKTRNMFWRAQHKG